PVYKPKWYKDAYDPAHATPVKVTDGGADTIDFALARFVFPTLVHLKGTVRDSTGKPLKGANVAVTRTVQEMHEMSSAGETVADLPGETLVVANLGCVQGVAWRGLTDSTGAYDAMVLSQRSYIALAAKEGFFPQFYDHKNTPSDATIIPVTGDVSGIDFNLNPYRPPQMYSISGLVWDSAGVRVPSRIIVFPLRSYAARSARFGFTDSLGAYSVDHLLAGKYIVFAVPFGKYAPAFYKAGAFGVIHWKDADTVTVASDVAGINVGVVQIHSSGVTTLSGTITSGGRPLEGVNVLAQDAGGAVLGFGMTDGAGSYVIDALPAEKVTLTADLMGYDGAGQSVSITPTQFTLSQDFSLGVTTSVSLRSGVPQAYALGQNYPNPFNPSTRISFSLPQAGTVNLTVFNLLGQEVTTLVNGAMSQGSHETVWDGRDAAGRVLSSGVYFYRIEVKGLDGGSAFSAMRKMVLLK
ncbi:MAG TPA: carboxypeptidase regulatory-like domain-containing protein, partial [Bacteroidota bacterium]|nr:carboxypeptidase regulatory-like domain-containing protein [Bacteroidota bacterium]